MRTRLIALGLAACVTGYAQAATVELKLQSASRVGDACAFGENSLDSVGELRAFTACRGVPGMTFAHTAGRTLVIRRTSYRGAVVRSTTAAGWTWVLSATCNAPKPGGLCGSTSTLRVGGVDPQGRLRPQTVLSTTYEGGGLLAATGPSWWALWDDATGVRQARTGVATAPARGLTQAPHDLVLGGTGPHATYADAVGNVWYSHTGIDGTWVSQFVAPTKTRLSQALGEGGQCEPGQCSPSNTPPDPDPVLGLSGSRVYIAYNDAADVRLATNVGAAAFTTESVPDGDQRNPGAGPSGPLELSTSGDNVAIAWDENQSPNLFDGTWATVSLRTTAGWQARRLYGSRNTAITDALDVQNTRDGTVRVLERDDRGSIRRTLKIG